MTDVCCPRCGEPYGDGAGNLHERRRSRDHILPVERGGSLIMFDDVKNIQIMCQACNGFRAACFHCWGLVACIQAVAETDGVTRGNIYARWNIGHGYRTTQQAESAIRRKRNREAVRIGMIVSKIGVDEFIWPADTAAKQVWNLATLRMGSKR